MILDHINSPSLRSYLPTYSRMTGAGRAKSLHTPEGIDARTAESYNHLRGFAIPCTVQMLVRTYREVRGENSQQETKGSSARCTLALVKCVIIPSPPPPPWLASSPQTTFHPPPFPLLQKETCTRDKGYPPSAPQKSLIPSSS